MTVEILDRSGLLIEGKLAIVSESQDGIPPPDTRYRVVSQNPAIELHKSLGDDRLERELFDRTRRSNRARVHGSM